MDTHEDSIIHKGQRGYAALGLFLSDLEAELAYQTTYLYRGHSLTSNGEGWLLVLRASKGSRRVVAFFGGRTPLKCYRRLYEAVVLANPDWKEDRYNK